MSSRVLYKSRHFACVISLKRNVIQNQHADTEVLIVLGLLICLHTIECYPNTFNKADERPAIVQFFKYIDEISNYTAESITDLLLGFFRSLYNSVPENHRGSTAGIVKTFIDNLEFARSTGNTAKMQEAAADFDNVEEKLLGSLMKGEQEDIIIKQDSFQMIVLLRRLAGVSENFLHKLNRAAHALSAKFTDEGFGRHEKLFSLFTELKNTSITDGQRPDELLGQLNDLKMEYMG